MCVASTCRALDEAIQYDSHSSAPDSGNSFENENEEHSVIPTTSGTEMYFLLVNVPNLVDQLDKNQSFFKIRVCIFIISLLCIFTFTRNNFTKKWLLKLCQSP